MSPRRRKIKWERWCRKNPDKHELKILRYLNKVVIGVHHTWSPTGQNPYFLSASIT